MREPPLATSATAGSAPLRLRQATSADARALAAFAAECFVDTFGADNTPEDMASYVAESFGEAQQLAELRDAACTVLLAERDGALGGYALLRDGATPAGASRVPLDRPIEIARLYAGRRWIGTGVGAALMQACLDVAAARGRDWIWLGVWERNARAIAFYARWGFTDVGSQHFQLGADRQTDRIMARRAAAQE
jgi:GNAT superfamily N-acetyltransferase